MPVGHISGGGESAVECCGQCALNAKIKGLNFIQLEQDLEKRLKRSEWAERTFSQKQN